MSIGEKKAILERKKSETVVVGLVSEDIQMPHPFTESNYLFSISEIRIKTHASNSFLNSFDFSYSSFTSWMFLWNSFLTKFAQGAYIIIVIIQLRLIKAIQINLVWRSMGKFRTPIEIIDTRWGITKPGPYLSALLGVQSADMACWFAPFPEWYSNCTSFVRVPWFSLLTASWSPQ